MWAEGNSKKKNMFGTKSGARKNIVLGVSASARAQKKARMYNGALLAGVPAALVLTTMMLLLAGRWLFTGNERFTVTKLEIKTGKLITEEEIRKSIGVAEGSNIFAFNIRDSRNKFLRTDSRAKSIVIRRQLPETVKIEVNERTPVAKLGTIYNFYVDNEGYVFGLNGQQEGRFPVVTGCSDEVERPGGKADTRVISALELIEAADKLGLAMLITRIDVENPVGVAAYVICEGVPHKGRIRWEAMGRRDPRGATDLQKRLTDIQAMLSTEQGRRGGDFDATRADGCVSLLPAPVVQAKAGKTP